MTTLFDVLDATEARNRGNDNVKSTNNDKGSINWRAGSFDAVEMVKANSGESIVDAANRRANISQAPDGTVQMFGVFEDEKGTHAWHDIGTALFDAATSAEALAVIKADFDLIKAELETLNPVTGEIDKSGAYAVYRSDTGDMLTYGKSVGEGYETVAPRELLDFADSIVGEGIARYETGAVLGKGERVFFLMRMPGEMEIREGDNLIPYMLITAANDGSGGVHFIPTFERPVCDNTLRIARDSRNRTLSMSFRHSKNVKANIQRAVTFFNKGREAQEHYADQCRTLASTEIDDQQARQLFNVSLDELVDVTIAGERVTSTTMTDGSLLNAIAELSQTEQEKATKQLERAQNRRDNLLAHILDEYHSDHCPGSTAFDAVQAVNGALEHGRRKNGATDKAAVNYKGDPRTRDENHRMSQIDGQINNVTQTVLESAVAAYGQAN